METHEIVIEYADPAKFKEGMNEIRRQQWHIESQIKELNAHRDRLLKMHDDALNYYCDPDNRYVMSKIEIPKRFAKVR